jgi:hypothetical protein
MKIILKDNMSIATVQQLFNDLFPFLKIEFFEKEYKHSHTISTKKRVSSTIKKLFDFKINHTTPSDICIHANMKVTDLEKEFNSLYKLQTQVFRKSGNIWLEATITDGWTLEEQNNHGEIITQLINK